MSGKIFAVGFGPGQKKYMTLEAIYAIENSDIIVGYTTYVDMLKKEFPDKNYLSTSMKKEVDRCVIAVSKALLGNTVAMVSSGDSGIYGMAGILLQTIHKMNADIEIEIVSGVTAASACASVLGAPLMHDFVVISLSDLMTPLDLIYKRVDLAAQGDFVICLYNPKSKKRTDYLKESAKIIMKHRNAKTPVGIVRNAGREDIKSVITTLDNLENEDVDMFCTVIIGNSQTYVENGKIITPRGYKFQDD
jgi:precorrin-3B C17-methyltransferase